ncbi:MAG: RsiV family protein [Mycobacterium sp.]|jgi:hypothetical protein
MGIRYARALSGLALVASVVIAPAATAAPDASCTAILGGDWADENGTCSTTVGSVRAATMNMSAQLPRELLDHPTAGQVLKSYLGPLTEGWRKTGESMVRDSDYRVDYQSFSHDALTSIVFHEFWQAIGTTPNDAYRTFTFDLAEGRQLQLDDLVKPGVDPLIALPPLVRPYLSLALNQARPPHDPGTYPFTPQEWEPQPDGSGYSGNYRSFAITPDELILYMPDVPMAHEDPWPRDRFVWSMDGGTVIVRVPLSALEPILAI